MQSELTPETRRPGFPPTQLEAAGRRIATGAYVTGALALGETVVSAHGDGQVRIFEGEAPERAIPAHKGAILAMAKADDGSVLTGGDDGRLLRISAEGAVEELATFGSAWVDCVAAHGGTGVRACSVGKVVHAWRPGVPKPDTFEHPSTVGGLAFDRKGRRLAVAHYGGVTILELQGRRWRRSNLAWAGSHIGVAWSPDGKFLVTVMQENALHGWRVRDRADMQMAGYPAKPRSLDWVEGAPHLVTSGADEAICWPFDGKSGPMGRNPVCVAAGGGQPATCVRAIPGRPAVLAGFQDGSVLASEVEHDANRRVVRGSTGAEVTAMAITPSGARLLIGDAAGALLLVPLNPLHIQSRLGAGF